MKLKTVLFFDSMLTPKIITIVYWIMLFASISIGLFMLFGGMGSGFWEGLMVIVFGSIGARLWSELMIVMFKINANLQRLADKS